MAQQIKLYGERHTNTNYLSRLIELNLRCALVEGVVPTPIRTVERMFRLSRLRDWYFKRTYAENLGWKHSAPLPHIVAESVVFLTLTKNPYSWLLSMYRRPYHQSYQTQPSLEEFLQLPWITVGRENVPAGVGNPIELWNIKNRSYLSLPENRTLHINTESTFVDAAGSLTRCGKIWHRKNPSRIYRLRAINKKAHGPGRRLLPRLLFKRAMAF